MVSVPNLRRLSSRKVKVFIFFFFQRDLFPPPLPVFLKCFLLVKLFGYLLETEMADVSFKSAASHTPAGQRNSLPFFLLAMCVLVVLVEISGTLFFSVCKEEDPLLFSELEH